MQIDENLIQNAPAMLSKLRAEAARRSFKEFIHQAWETVEPGRKLTWGWALDAMADHLQAVAEGDIKKLAIFVPPGFGKALTHDTPIMTLDGWKNHGDLKAGDYVFGADGYPKRVIAVGEDIIDECYDVAFDDGPVIRAGQAHEWPVERDFEDAESGWARVRRPHIAETRELLTTDGMTRKGSRRDRIRLAEPLYGVRRNLLIEPYLLGYWLGDGSSDSAHLYVSETDLNGVAHYGPARKMERAPTHTQNFYRIYVEGLALPLRALNLLKNKHVPEEYLLASYEQRLALLQGLMDSDGSCGQNGNASFSNKNKKLVDAVLYLARSLGCKPTVKEKYVTLKGKRYGPHYQVFFRPPKGMDLFRLKRKNDRIKPMTGANSARTRVRYVKSITPVGRQPCRCIEVEGGVYLAGEGLVPTHNSRLTRVFYPCWVWTREPHHKFLSASYGIDLTIRDTLDARRIILSDWYTETFGLKIAEDDGGRSGFSLDTLGTIKAITVGGKTTGFRGDSVLFDDIIGVQDANSPSKRAEAIEWFRESAQNRVNDLNMSARVLIMQRIHEDDPGALAMKMGYEPLIIPMEWDESLRRTTSIGWTDPRTQEGDLAFPERFPPESIEEFKDAETGIGSYAYSAQYQQQPVPRKGAFFATENIDVIDELPDDDFTAVRAWDLAASAGTGAYTAGVKLLWGKKTKRFYFADVSRGQWGAGQARDEMSNTAEDDGTSTRIVIPQDPGQAGKAQADDIVAQLLGFDVRVERQSGDKETRANPLSAQIDRGHVAVLKRPWTQAFLDELRMFPKGKWKDQVDAASSAFNMLSSMVRTKKRTLNLVVGGERQENWAGTGGKVANL